MFLKVGPGPSLNTLFFNDLENDIAWIEPGALLRCWTVIDLIIVTLP
jgi:hypothetical protein